MSTGFSELVTNEEGRLPIKGMYETDLDFCKRAFGGKEFECRRCGEPTFWPGVCDSCDVKLKNKTITDKGPTSTDGKMERAGVPTGYSAWKWLGCALPAGINKRKLRKWQGDPPLLSLVGPTGTGKTGAGVCFVRDWIETNNRARWIYVPDWLDLMRWSESHGDGAYIEYQRVSELKGLVVLDELITARSTDYGTDKVLQVIDARIRNSLPTIITTNLSIDKIATIDDRVASRITGGQVVVWGGEDRRRG